MSTFNIIIEETEKAAALAQIEQAQKEKRFSATIAAAMSAVVSSLPGSQVAVAFNGSDEPSGFLYASWQSHSDVRDVPTEEERKLPNEAGYERDPETGAFIEPFRPDFEGMRTRAMAARLKREPRL